MTGPARTVSTLKMPSSHTIPSTYMRTMSKKYSVGRLFLVERDIDTTDTHSSDFLGGVGRFNSVPINSIMGHWPVQSGSPHRLSNPCSLYMSC